MVGSDEARAHDPRVPALSTDSAAPQSASLSAFVVRVHGARLRSCLVWAFVKRGLPLLCFAFAVSIVFPMIAFGCLVCASGIAAVELLFVFVRERRGDAGPGFEAACSSLLDEVHRLTGGLVLPTALR